MAFPPVTKSHSHGRTERERPEAEAEAGAARLKRQETGTMQETKITTRPEHMEQKDASRPCQFLHLEDAEISRQRDDGLVEVRESAVLMYVSKQRLSKQLLIASYAGTRPCVL